MKEKDEKTKQRTWSIHKTVPVATEKMALVAIQHINKNKKKNQNCTHSKLKMAPVVINKRPKKKTECHSWHPLKKKKDKIGHKWQIDFGPNTANTTAEL